MMSEKGLEDIICKYPELIEDGLKFKGRQIRVHGKILDVLFEDKCGDDLIVELKIGTLLWKYTGQLIIYEGSILSDENPTARVMFVANRVPPNLGKGLTHHGIEWKEIALSELKEFVQKKNDASLIKYFTDEKESADNKITAPQTIADNADKTEQDDDIEVSVESFLGLVTNATVLNQINILREKIKSLDSQIYEYARKWTWLIYRLNRQFCGIDIYRKHFIVSINLPRDMVYQPEKLDIANLKDKHYVKIKIHPDTDLELIFENIRKAFDRQS